MDKTEIIKIQNRRKIAKVTMKYPALMNDSAEYEIRRDYQTLIDLEDRLRALKDDLMHLEKRYREAKEDFQAKSMLFDIEFETIEKVHTTHDSSIGITGMGNDLIGHKASI